MCRKEDHRRLVLLDEQKGQGRGKQTSQNTDITGGGRVINIIIARRLGRLHELFHCTRRRTAKQMVLCVSFQIESRVHNQDF